MNTEKHLQQDESITLTIPMKPEYLESASAFFSSLRATVQTGKGAYQLAHEQSEANRQAKAEIETAETAEMEKALTKTISTTEETSKTNEPIDKGASNGNHLDDSRNETIPPPPPPPSPPTPDTVNQNQGELDSAGNPWNSTIHTGAKTKIANGTWKLIRNVDKNLVKNVLASNGTQPPPPPPPTLPSDNNENGGTIQKITKIVSENLISGAVTIEQIEAVAKSIGADSYSSVVIKPELWDKFELSFNALMQK